MLSRKLARACALPAATGIIALTAAPAAAHVSISPSEATAGSYAVLTVSVPHGCDGSPTTKVAIQLPEQILSVTPTRNAMWEVDKVMEKLDKPVTDAHGNKVTERVDQVVYSARTPLPEGYRDAFDLSLQIPDAAGETLTFPVIQTCQKGETAWVETAANGETEELEAPAPTLTVLPAGGEAHGGTGASSGSDNDEAEKGAGGSEVSAAAGASDDSVGVLGVSGLVAGLLGLAAGVAALVMVRRRS